MGFHVNVEHVVLYPSALNGATLLSGAVGVQDLVVRRSPSGRQNAGRSIGTR